MTTPTKETVPRQGVDTDGLAREFRLRHALARVKEAVYSGLTDEAAVAAVKRALQPVVTESAGVSRAFDLVRRSDVSGVSGTGRVAEGFEFEDGTVAMRWLGRIGSTTLYDRVEDVSTIHGHGGSTEVVFRDY